MPEATVKVARDSFPEVGTLPRVPETDAANPYLAQARHYIEQRGQTDMRNILIDTVYVTHHKRLESTRPEHRLAARTWTAEQIKEAGAGTILDFIARMPGILMRGTNILYRREKVQFMLDGLIEEPLEYSLYHGTGERSLKRLKAQGMSAQEFYNPLDESPKEESKRNVDYREDYDELPSFLWYPLNIVERIDLIESSNMVLWGATSWRQVGIISITTKKGKDLDDATRTLPARDVEFVSPLGYQTPAEFYAPAYATEKARRSMVPDYRTTLYWNPTVKLDDTGQATVEFYTSDAPVDYDITIEGITQTGKIVRTVKIITE